MVRVSKIDWRWAAALLGPLPLLSWIPPWGGDVIQLGMHDAVLYCVSIAIFEELLFRGALQGSLLRSRFFQVKWLALSKANWLTSLMFALAHLWQHPWFLWLGYFAVSLLFGDFRERYRSVLAPVSLHGYYNLLLLWRP